MDVSEPQTARLEAYCRFREPWLYEISLCSAGTGRRAGRPAVRTCRCGRGNQLPDYAHRGADMIRRERLPSGRWKVTTLANFQARIVRDLILHGGAGRAASGKWQRR